jgi:hypothetical protein
MTPSSMQIVGTCIFIVAILHTFSTKFFERLALRFPNHAGAWGLLAEVEIVFGFWAFVMMFLMFGIDGSEEAIRYLDSCNFSEPMFVFAIMVMAATRPILRLATKATFFLSRFIPLPREMGFYLAILMIIPMLGSFITEPATMTLGALILRDRFLKRGISTRMQYVTLGVLLVNVSIGGTLTPFAAPPVVMVAGKWDWNIAFMIGTFGWKAAIACLINALGATFLFRKELTSGEPKAFKLDGKRVPYPLLLIHVLSLAGIIVFAHHPAIFMGFFLLFLGVVQAYTKHQSRLILREGLLVGFFLSGLVVLGGEQQWWLQQVLLHMTSNQVFVGATILTSFTDNAALTYLGSLVEGLSDSFKYALLAGAVTGGGLTIIANAPNPAGISILKEYFEQKSVHPLYLFLAAFLPTVVAACAFLFL